MVNLTVTCGRVSEYYNKIDLFSTTETIEHFLLLVILLLLIRFSCSSYRREFGAEFINSIPISHRLVALATDGTQIIQCGRSTFRLGNIMTRLEIKWCHYVLTPRNVTLAVKYWSTVVHPYCIPQRLGDGRL
jgi:hypothetical protein